MGRGKKIAAAAALIAVIALAVYFIVYGFGGALTPPPVITEMAIEKIDNKTFEIKTLPLGEWVKLGERAGIYKNPDTGEYTMAPTLTCSACGKVIPDPPVPSDVVGNLEKIPAWEKSVKCPLCGENPF